MAPTQYLVVIAAALLANMPFLFDRHFLGIPLPAASYFIKQNGKSLFLRLLELLILYFIVGVLAGVLEGKYYGDVFKQGWEFYAITFAFFLVLAYPGFVFRYLWQSRKHHAG